VLGKTLLVVVCMVGSASAQARDPWLREIVDYGRADGMVGLALAGGAPSIAAGFPSDLAVVALVRGAQGWTSTALHDGRRADLIVTDGSGAHRLILGSDKGRGLLVDGKLELIGLPTSDGFDVTFDAGGSALACAVEGSNLASYVKLAEHGVKPAAWKTSEVSKEPARQCAVAVTADGVPVIATANSAEAWVHVRRDGVWKPEKLSAAPGGGLSPMIAAARAPDGSVGVAFVDGRGIGLARLTKAGWDRSVLVKDTGGVPEAVVLAFDASSRPHVAYMTWVPKGSTTKGAIGYAVAGSAPSKIEDAVATRIALVIDAEGAPHLAYFHNSNGDRPGILVYVRARKAGDVADAWLWDTDAVVAACAEQLAVDLGRVEDPDVAKRGRAERLCSAWDRVTPSIAQLETRCMAGDANACVVSATLLADKSSAYERYELFATPCRQTRCFTTHREMLSSTFTAPAPAPDAARSRTLYAKACELGVGVGCLLSDQAAKACSARLPMACAAALGGTTQLDRATMKAMRAELEKACAYQSPTERRYPEACNSLAFMEDTGDGGRKNAAAAKTHHTRACLDGSALSCAKIVGGAKPKGLTAEAFTETMQRRCDTMSVEACVALGTAYQTGWLVKRAPDEAKRLFKRACFDLGERAACARAR